MKATIIFIVGLSIVAASCNSKNKVEEAEAYQVVSPLIKDNTYSSEYVAEIQSVKYVEVRSRVKGYIEKIHVDEGQAVKEGQLLFTLNFLEHEKELQKATAAYKNTLAGLKAAEVEFANVKLLVEKNIVSQSELDMMKARVEALKADVDEAIANKEQAEFYLSFSKIKAPYNGIINRIPNKVGSLIEEGGMLTSISDNREVFAYFNLSENDYLNYITNGEKKTKAVSLKLSNNELYAYEGNIEIIESEFDRSTGNIAFRARFPNSDAILKHGANGKVIVSKVLKNAMIIPQKSTFEIQDKIYVYVVNKDSVLEQRNVILKMRFPDFYVVKSGLNKEDRILFEGVENVRDGNKIQPEYIDLEKVMSLENKNQ
jgi:RND family efflux transporter MFP subunit